MHSVPLGPSVPAFCNTSYRTPLVVAASAGTEPPATSTPATPMAAAAIMHRWIMRISHPFRQSGGSLHELPRYPRHPLPVQNLGGHLAEGIAAMSRICDS